MIGLLVAAVVAAAPPPARFVVAIGYNGAGDDRPMLAHADDDAARLYTQEMVAAERAWLLTTFDAETARLYPDLAALAREPTRVELARALGEAAWNARERREAGQATELVFFFAGHGDVTPRGEGYLVLADGAFTRSDLHTHVVRGSAADINHIIIDACASYFMVAERGTPEEATAAPVPLTPALLDVLRGDGARERRLADPAAWARTGTLVATSSSAATHESAELGAGVFSFLFRSALSGAADVNGDGRVEYSEAAAFIRAASGDLPDPRARLDVHAVAPAQAPHVALADLARLTEGSLLYVEPGRPQRLRLRDARGLPYIELHRDGSTPVTVRLVGNPFYVVEMGDREALLVARDAGAYALSALEFRRRPTRARGALPAHEALFSRPFGEAYLAGFLADARLPAPHAGAPLVVQFAPRAAPQEPFPYGAVGATTLIASGALAIFAGGAAAANLMSFGELERRFAASATIDPEVALQVEVWRASALILTAASAAAAATGAALLWLDGKEESR
jgi:hypothetical protein